MLNIFEERFDTYENNRPDIHLLKEEKNHMKIKKNNGVNKL